MSKDCVVPMPEAEEAPEQPIGPISLVDLAAEKSRESKKTTDSKKDPVFRAGYDTSRIHFTLEKEGDSKIPTLLSGGLGYRGPIELSASHRFTEIHMNNDVEEGLYNIRLAVSLNGLKVDRIESISFSQRHHDRLGALEVFTHHELCNLKDQLPSPEPGMVVPSPEPGMVVLGLHRQYCVEKFEPRSFVMEIRTTTRPLPLNDPGYIKIHYMELDITQYETDVDEIDGAPFKLHRPFIWSVDVGIKDDTPYQQTPAVPNSRNASTLSGRIIYYAVSGDGNYAATLSTRGKILQLDMWHLGSDTRCIANTSTTEGQETECHCITCKAPVTPKPCGQRQITIDEPLDSDIFFDGRYDYLRYDPSPLQIAVSYDASRVVLMDSEKKYLHDAPFQVFEFWEDRLQLSDGDGYIEPDLSSTCGDHIRPDLRDFSGYGKFHFTSESRDLKDELFITCDGMHVDIFTINRVHDQSGLDRVYDEWERVRRITLAEEKEDDIPMPRRLIEGLSGKYFHFLARDETQLVGDLETGKLLHGIADQGTGSISGDGSMMLIHQYPNIITTRWTESGTVLGKTDLSVGNLYSSGPSFIKNDKYVLVPVSKNDDSYGKGRLGMILDSSTLSVPERVSYTSRYHEQLPQIAGDRGQFLCSSHGSKLDMVRVQDTLVTPYPQSKYLYLCDDECLGISAVIDEAKVRLESEEVKETVKETVNLDDDLTISVGFEEVAEKQFAVVVSIANSQGESREVIRIPPLKIRGLSKEIVTRYGIHVDQANLQLFVVCDLFAMVWKLSTTYNGDVTLQSCVWTRLFNYEDTLDPQEVAETVVFPTTLKVCNHGRIIVTSKSELGEPSRPNDGSTNPATPKSVKKGVKHVRIADDIYKSEAGSTTKGVEPITYDGSHVTKKKTRRSRGTKGKIKKKYNIPAPESITFPLYSDGSFRHDPFRFFNGFFALMHMFYIGKDPLRQAILKYVGLHINRAVECNGRTLTILRAICRRVSETNYTLTEAFLKAIFNSPHVRWVPMPNRERYLNPISLLLRRCEELPRAINLAQIVINYCLRMSKKEGDLHFSLPVLSSLHELFKLKERPPDLVTNILGALAYCPARERAFIIDRAIIAHAPSFRGLFRTPKKQPIYAYRDPVFGLDRSLLFKEHDPLNENFTRDLFVASFDMLWRSPDLEQEKSERTPLERITDYGPIPSPSWIRVLYYFHLCKIMPRPHRRIKLHDLPLEALDNPAIAALIEYKWNTIGYKYWLVRFCWQFVFYIMVLVAVLLQVYDPTQGYSLKGVFIAIIVMGAIFLALELRQFFRNPHRYVTSPYNFVDLLAFGVPVAGSIIQVINIDNDNNQGHKATLSFSVLFIFIHMLYELRVNRSVCRFVAIIVRIVSKIRVFFLIFAAGIIAFSIAILHLIRGCPVGVCDTSDTKFPYLFHRAISTTYFMMGGIWDPVEDEFEEDESWALHAMIMLYYFFTTILLLNVLIALMNAAFTEGDVVWEFIWRKSRLRCIEEAETVSYNIPNYREAHQDIFPKKIYYFGTRKEQKKYWEKYSDGHEADDGATLGGGGGGGGGADGSNNTDAGSNRPFLPSTPSQCGNSSYLGMAAQLSRMTELKAIRQIQEEMKQDLKQSQDQMRCEFEKMILQSQGAQTQAQAELRALKEQLAEMKELLVKAKP